MRLALAISLTLTGAAQAQSDIAPQVDAILQGHVAEGCLNGQGGRFVDGVYQRDLTGDGLVDLIVDHGGMSCVGDFGRSGFCGAQVCSVIFYVNQGGTLTEVQEILAIVGEISDTPVPLIGLHGHGGGRNFWRWNGSAFVNIGE
ncbi:MAG: hypothetical protein AAGL23_09705 [Pseudomonadota bacterium]